MNHDQAPNPSLKQDQAPKFWRTRCARSAGVGRGGRVLFAHRAPSPLIASYTFLGFGFYLLSSAWDVPYHAQRRHALAQTGPYARFRHPRYLAFVLISLGSLLQWPTRLTLLMFPVLLVMYGRLAMTEEAEIRTQFGAEFGAYAAHTSRFCPKSTASTAAQCPA